jgi:hypothetical protein
MTGFVADRNGRQVSDVELESALSMRHSFRKTSMNGDANHKMRMIRDHDRDAVASY